MKKYQGLELSLPGRCRNDELNLADSFHSIDLLHEGLDLRFLPAKRSPHSLPIFFPK
jgi:hypothetical protein